MAKASVRVQGAATLGAFGGGDDGSSFADHANKNTAAGWGIGLWVIVAVILFFLLTKA